MFVVSDSLQAGGCRLSTFLTLLAGGRLGLGRSSQTGKAWADTHPAHPRRGSSDRDGGWEARYGAFLAAIGVRPRVPRARIRHPPSHSPSARKPPRKMAEGQTHAAGVQRPPPSLLDTTEGHTFGLAFSAHGDHAADPARPSLPPQHFNSCQSI